MRFGHFFITLVFSIFLIACNKAKDTSSVKARVEINSNIIYADNFDELVIKVFDESNNDITNQSAIFVDNKLITGSRFKTSELKDFTIKAKIGENETGSVKFKAIRHEVSKFKQKVIMEEFAGTWCSFCTRFTYIIDTMVQSNSNIIPIQVHSGDAFEYSFVQQMRNKFGVSGFPSGYFNRGRIWDESTAMITSQLNQRSKLGLSINSSSNANTVTATVKVKFDVSTSEQLNIVVALLEDSLVFPQANFYNNTFGSPFYGLGDPIQNYRHNNILRLAATDIFGDLIPIDAQIKDNTWEKNYTINAAGFNLKNCKLVAYVQYAQNNVSRWGVLNAQKVIVGNAVSFD